MGFTLNQFLLFPILRAEHWLASCSSLLLTVFLALPAWAQNNAETTVSEAPSNVEQPSVNLTPAKTAPDTQTQKLTLLSEAYQNKGLVSLNANGKSFPGLWHTDTSGTPLGAVLIFHDAGENANWPSTVAVLHQHLTLFGWATLSIELPDPVPPIPPERPPARPKKQVDAETPDAETPIEEPSQDKPNDASPKNDGGNTSTDDEAVETEVKARAKAAMDFLNEKGQFNIVFVGYGLGATRAARFLDGMENLQTGKLDKQLREANAKAVIARSVRALILIDARNTIPFSGNNQMIAEWLNDETLPVLDIYTGTHYLSRTEPQQRKKAIRKKQLQKYSQVHLNPPGQTSEEIEDRLAKRIRGFLNKHAKGVQLDGY